MTDTSLSPRPAAPGDLPAAGRAAAAPAPARILVVDDEETIRLALGRFLRLRGYEPELVSGGPLALQAVTAAPAGHYALMLCDVRMPGMSGLDVVARAHAADPELAVVMLSAVNDAATARAAFTAGASDYLVKPLELTALQQAIERALQQRALAVGRRTTEDALRREVADQHQALRQAHAVTHTASMAVAEALVTAMEAKDPYAGGRAARVAALAASIASELGMDEDAVETVRLAARVHDVGVIGISDTVLNKPGALTPEETAHVREHVRLGMEILAPLRMVGGEEMDAVLRAVADHHERWDGAGYPRGLAGTSIDLGGRVLAAADAYDAVTSTRAYRGAMTQDEALVHLGRLAGSLLDPTVYAALAAVVRRGAALTFLE